MLDLELDGDSLTAHGTNRASRVALAGEDYKDDVVIHASEVVSIERKRAGALTNGRIDVRTSAGKRYQLHYLKKHSGEIAPLIDAFEERVRASSGTAAAEPSVVEEQDPAPPPPPSVPAGWYPQGDVQRYWDGSQWTEHTAPLAPNA